MNNQENIDIYKYIDLAIKARDKAYAPYSKFKVGSLLLLKNGQTILGSNVENASYGLSLCAERNAMFHAYNLGYTKNDIIMLVVVGDTKKPISPCGACRQVMVELLPKDCKIILANLNKEYKEYTLEELLPYAFEEVEI